ncbi:glycoside hydrolase family 16 protein [Novosphingobium sp. BW1]|uniref:glycoside hydrolase family 16 protein n=1 Tax=Novosphingobium sp. BW1 TaxID=2592621 RepID=UPI00196776D4|nr:glycoside hydrolase family 16 protein [Novosphingobium sp. BW1]
MMEVLPKVAPVRGVRHRRIGLGGLAVLIIGAFLVTGAGRGEVAAGAAPQLGEALAIERFTLTFEENFDKLDVSAWGPGTRWIAHTPWAGDFGDAVFRDPQPDGPFQVKAGILTIEMRERDGRWESGLLSAADSASRGFLQSGGYFEMRARLPGGPGVWPAFWLGSNAHGDRPNPEIDVLEYYGQFPDAYLATTHVWQDGKSQAGETYRVDVPAHALEQEFHTFGVAIDRDFVTFYLDREVVATEPTRAEYLQPMFPMVNLAAGGGWPIEGMKSPSRMLVDYVRVYRAKDEAGS